MQDWILIRVYLIINHEKQIDFTLKETLRFPPPIKLTATIYVAEILLKVASNTITLTLTLHYCYINCIVMLNRH
jgi:hypothetical protein